jgi:uncharacterized protein YhaN
MRIEWLDFEWVGFWRGRRLDLSPGLTLILGDNEAGKSTALRAIDALFGGTSTELVAPRRIGEFALGAGLNHAGESLEIWRRQGRLFGPNRAEADPRFAQWVTPAWVSQFRELFRLSYDELRQGDSDILRRDGAIGRLLLEMQAGRGALGAAADSIDEQLARRFRRHANAKTILRERIEALKSVSDRAAQVGRSDDWNRAITHKEDAERRFQETRERLEEARQRCDWWRRLRSHWGELQAWRERDQELRRALASEAALPDRDWIAQVHSALEDLDRKLDKRQNRQDGLLPLQQSLDGLPAPSPLLGFSDEIRSLAQRRTLLSGGAEAAKAQRDASLRAHDAIAQSLEAIGLSREVSPEEVAALVLPAPRRAPIQEALKALEEAGQRMRGTVDELDDARAQREIAQAAVEALPPEQDPTELDQIRQIDDARVHAAADAGKAAGDRDHEAAELQWRLAQAGFAPLAPSDCLRLPRPMRTLADDAGRRVSQAEVQRSRCQEAVDVARRQVKECEERRTALAEGADDDIPTAQRLTHARRERDKLFLQIRAAWSPPFGEGAPAALEGLAPLYEALVSSVDLLADRAIEQARRAEERRLLAEQADRLRGALAQCSQALRDAADDTTTAGAAYAALFDATVLRAPQPNELAAWYERLDAIDKAAERWTRSQEAFAKADSERAALETRMRTSLAAAGLESMAALDAEQRRRELSANQRKEALRWLDQAVTLEGARLRAHQQAVIVERNASSRWDEVAQTLPAGLPGDPSTAAAWLQEQDRLANALRSLATAASTLEQRTKDQQELQADTLRLLDRLTAAWPDADGLRHDPDAAITQMEQERERSASVENARSTLLLQRQQAIADLAESASAVDAALQSVAALTETTVDDPDERAALDSRLERAEACLRGQEDLRRLAGSIEAALGEQPRSLLDGELAGLTEDDLTREALAAEQILDERQRARDRSLEARSEAERQLEGLKTSEDGWIAQQRVQATDALAQELDDLVPLMVARTILEKAQELARDGASPFLDEAGAFLAELTQGAWTGLMVTENAGTTVLEAVSEHEGHRRTSELSDGTRDPLRFALRLAAVVRAHRARPMPLVLDDFLVHFDDQRTAAALRLLARLAREQSMQILMFTHHDHVLHLAAEHIPGQYLHQILASPGRERLPRLAARPALARPSIEFQGGDEEAAASMGMADASFSGDRQDELVLEILQQADDWLPKGAILAGIATAGLAITDAQWQTSIRALESEGRIVATGQKRGKKYALPGRFEQPSEDRAE